MPKKITADIIESKATNLDIASLVENINSNSGVIVSDAAGGVSHITVEDGATGDQTDAEIEAAYNNQVSQVSAPEISAGTESAVRRMSPADIKAFIDAHAADAGIQNNLSATTNPSATDDSGAGYAIGSVWINTTSDEAFRCVDASAAAAVWINTTLTTSELATLAVTGDWTDIQNKPSAFTPDTHATTHQSGGSDAIKLDDLAAPDDNTDLDATASLHGLMPKVDKSKLDAIEASATANPNAVDGPASATDQQLPVFDGTTGKLLKAITGFLIDGNNVLSLPNGIKFGSGSRPAASSSYDGVLWYSKTGSVSSLDICMQTESTPTYAWVNLVSYPWD